MSVPVLGLRPPGRRLAALAVVLVTGGCRRSTPAERLDAGTSSVDARAPAREPPVGWIAAAREGAFVVSSAGRGPASPGRALRRGDRVGSGAAESARVRIDLLGGRGRFHLEAGGEATLTPDGLSVSVGRVRGEAPETAGGARRIVTPHGTIQFSGSCVAEVGPSGTSVAQRTGWAEISRHADGATVRLRPGETVEVTRGAEALNRRPSAPRVAAGRQLFREDFEQRTAAGRWHGGPARCPPGAAARRCLSGAPLEDGAMPLGVRLESARGLFRFAPDARLHLRYWVGERSAAPPEIVVVLGDRESGPVHRSIASETVRGRWAEIDVPLGEDGTSPAEGAIIDAITIGLTGAGEDVFFVDEVEVRSGDRP